MLRYDRVRIRKPYNSVMDEMITTGVGKIDLNKRNSKPSGFNEWMYYSKRNLRGKIVDVRNVGSNRFIVTPLREMQKDVKRSMGGKYAVYHIL